MSNPNLIELFTPAMTTLQMIETDPMGFMAKFAGSQLEWWAVAATLLSVILAARQNVLTWPVGLVAVVLYGVLFSEVLLYSEVGLQLFFFVTQFVGWAAWIRMVVRLPNETTGQVVARTLMQGLRFKSVEMISQPEEQLRSLSLRECGLWLMGMLAGWVLVALLTFWAGGTLPVWDGALSVMSVAAQLLLIRKYWQSWVLWVLVDILAIGVYSYKELYASAGLYGMVLLPIAAFGLVSWFSQYRQQKAAGGATLRAAPAE